MNVGDLVMWKYNGVLNPEKIGIVLSDYTQSRAKDGSILKNIYWTDMEWVRPIEQQFLEVISEGR
tara:strand:- start:1622 stop:1816 length:195 start_codon:yes stop_codon:yes gene_type:complete